MSSEQTNEVKPKKTKRDNYTVVPLLVAIGFFLANFWIYSNYQTLIFVAGVLCVFLIGIVGLTKLLTKSFKRGASYILATIVFFAVSFVPACKGIREVIYNARHQIRFTIGKNKYESEANALRLHGGIYKEWKWGTSNGTNEYTLAYDGRDETILHNSEPDPDEVCSRSILKLKPHFFVIDDFCP